jgi:hypothetical protein
LYIQRISCQWAKTALDLGIFWIYIGIMGKKRGAPKKPAGKSKTANKLLRMTATELATFESAADLAGLGTSGWMRERLRTAARAELEAAKRPVAFLAALE